MTALQQLIDQVKQVTLSQGYDAGISLLWSLTIDGLGENAFHELLLAINEANAQRLGTNNYGFMLRKKGTQLFVRNLSLWPNPKLSATGKIWMKEAHLKSALTNSVAVIPRGSNTPRCTALYNYEVVNISTGVVSEAYDLWARPAKK